MLTSTANPRVRRIIRLRQRRQRDREGLFIIEGHRELAQAAGADWSVDEVFHCDAFFATRAERELLERLSRQGVPCQATSAAVFRKMSYRHTPDGLLGVARIPPCDLSALPVGDSPLWLVAAGIEKPGNLGAMLRSADAAGASGVIVADGATDPFNPNVVRASVGTLFSVPLAIASGYDARTWLAEQGIRAFAAGPAGTTPYTEAPLVGPVAFVVGSEHDGLAPAWLEGDTVRIPMAGSADSLNAATVAALLLFEARRQRGALAASTSTGGRRPEA